MIFSKKKLCLEGFHVLPFLCLKHSFAVQFYLSFQILHRYFSLVKKWRRQEYNLSQILKLCISGWLALMATCFVYNAWVIPFRYFFSEYQNDDNIKYWFFFDYLVADMLYLLDILLFKYRVMYMEKGFWVKVGSD